MSHHNETSDEQRYDDADVRSHQHLQIKEISSVWARGNAAQFSNFSVFSSWRELLTPRGCRIIEVLDVCKVLLPAGGAGGRSKMLTRLGQTGYWPKPVFRANHHFECRELTERMIIPFVIGSNSVVRRLPQTLAHTRVGATVLHGDGTKLSRARVSEQQCSMEIAQILAVTRFGATVLYGHQGPVPHPGPRGCQCLARTSQCLQLAFRRNSVTWTSRSSAALCCSRLSRQVRALRIERSLNE